MVVVVVVVDDDDDDDDDDDVVLMPLAAAVAMVFLLLVAPTFLERECSAASTILPGSPGLLSEQGPTEGLLRVCVASAHGGRRPHAHTLTHPRPHWGV